MGPVPSKPLRPGALRRLLDACFKTESQLTAFCVDCFRAVAHTFSTGMDRLSRTNLLLISIPAEKILFELSQYAPESLAQHHHILMDCDIDPVFGDIQAELLSLQHKKISLEASGQYDTALDEKLVELRRKLRQGPQLHEQDLLAQRYLLLHCIGAGGIAEVWQAYDQKLRTLVAVKVLHGQWSKDRSYRERFERGARQMLKLTHPNIVRVLAEPMTEDGFLFFVMEYLPGGDLHRAALTQKLSVRSALTAILQVGDALHFAHQRGLIHRDVKPANILLDAQGVAKLTDFDLVWCPDSTGGTRTGALGTFVYAAPEALEDAKQVDQRADIYSLGMTTLFALYGKPLPISVLRDPVPIISELNCSNSMKIIIETSIQWSTEHRYSDMLEFCSNLMKCIDMHDYAPERYSNYFQTKHRNAELAKLIISLSKSASVTNTMTTNENLRIRNPGDLVSGTVSTTLSSHLARSSIHPKSEALILLLEVKFKPLSPGQRQRILDCNTDLLLDDWLARVSTSTSVEDVLGKTIEEIMGFKK